MVVLHPTQSADGDGHETSTCRRRRRQEQCYGGMELWKHYVYTEHQLQRRTE